MENGKKKLLLITFEYPPTKGGIAAYLYGLCKNTPYDWHVLCDGKKKILAENVTVATLLFPRFFWLRWLAGLPAIIKKMREIKPAALVVSHTLPLGYVACIARFIARVPCKCILICHGMDVAQPRHFFWKRFLTGRVLRSVDYIIANSNFTKNIISQYGIPENKITVVYPGIDQKPLSSHHRNAPILLSLGRLTQRKGFDCVIMSLPQIVNEIKDVRYIIAGDGPDKQRLKKLAFALGVQEYVWFTGAVDSAMKEKLLASAQVFAMPSRNINGDVEGFGIVFLEAAMHSIPCVGSTHGGVPEAIDDTLSGVLVDPMSIDEISRAIITLMKSPELALNMGTHGRERALRLFSWEKVVQPFCNVINSV